MQRSEFIKSLGIYGIGLPVLPLHPPTPGTDAIRTNALTLTGRVVVLEKGVPGVQVTDGFTTTLTDGSGNYRFACHPDAEFVYITIPRGFAFDHDNGIASFYHKIERSGNEFRSEFRLSPLSADDSKHYFIVWADPQIECTEDAELLFNNSLPDTIRLIESYGADALFHGIGCGDLIWDQPHLFDPYKTAVSNTGIPFFHVKGNHDIDGLHPGDYSGSEFKKQFGPLYYSFNRGQVHYVVLDDVYFLGASGKYVGFINDRQMNWLKQDLSLIKPGSFVIVALHIPLDTGVKRRDQLRDEVMKDVVANREELLRALEGFDAHIISGHMHANEKIFHPGNVTEHVHGALCGAWWMGPICNDGTPNGYGVYEIDGNNVRWYHKSVGYDKAYQMHVYPVGAIPQNPECFAVNVWNWDPSWTVEWFENGESRGALEQRILYDPLSVWLYLGIDKPGSRKWIEPSLTDHIFIGKPTVDGARITIKVTDRFNSVYMNDIPEAADHTTYNLMTSSNAG